jgi:hypothetical protein
MSEGGGGLFSISSVGGVWIFSGMTHYVILLYVCELK